MAMHDFECLKCGEKFEALVSSCRGEKSAVECPKCKSVELKKLISKTQIIKDFFCSSGG
ncbi:MAG TPA: zinc ribbon domain-containing protein [Candidatus Wallbacteria bacterium]|nr:zinc ribbon domain-containing protein [Candidatus Wallbacteria bacterium]